MDPPPERPKACAAGPPFFSGPSLVLMAAYNGASKEDMGGCLTPLSLEACPELPPDAAGFPPAEAVVDGIPMAKFGGQIPSGKGGAGEIQNRFDEQTVAQL